MNALVIGFGKMGMLHAATLNALVPLRSLAVVERAPFVAEGVSAFNPSFKLYDDHRQALRSGPVDLAVIASPNETHLAIFKDLTAAGAHIFSEKPFTSGLEEVTEARRIHAQRADKARQVMVGFCLRYAAPFVRAEEFLRSGALGRIRSFRATMYSSDVEARQSGWRFGKKDGGGVLADLGSHLMDLVWAYFGTPERVWGFCESWVSEEVEDHAEAHLEYVGFSGSFEVSWSVPGFRKAEAAIRVVGENGTLDVALDGIRWQLNRSHEGYAAGSYEQDAVALFEPVPFDLAGSFYTKQWMAFLSAIRNNTPCPNGLDEALEVHRLLEAVRRSQRRPLEHGKISL